jgi:hypothetical protein
VGAWLSKMKRAVFDDSSSSPKRFVGATATGARQVDNPLRPGAL